MTVRPSGMRMVIHHTCPFAGVNSAHQFSAPTRRPSMSASRSWVM
ncbi:MAG: hypothetical protein R2695_03990 [Acidimicrobiales bacterium]